MIYCYLIDIEFVFLVYRAEVSFDTFLLLNFHLPSAELSLASIPPNGYGYLGDYSACLLKVSPPPFMLCEIIIIMLCVDMLLADV